MREKLKIGSGKSEGLSRQIDCDLPCKKIKSSCRLEDNGGGIFRDSGQNLAALFHY